MNESRSSSPTADLYEARSLPEDITSLTVAQSEEMARHFSVSSRRKMTSCVRWRPTSAAARSTHVRVSIGGSITRRTLFLCERAPPVRAFPGPTLCRGRLLGDGAVQVCLDRHRVPPNNSLQLTRLACGKSGVTCPPSCARMGGPMPEPPGS